MVRFVLGLFVGGVLVLGLASAQGGDWGGGPAPTETDTVTPSSTPPPDPPPQPTWVDGPMQAREDSYLARTGHCHAHQEIVRVFDPYIGDQWRSTHYRCRPER